jgi:ribonuclease Y
MSATFILIAVVAALVAGAVAFVAGRASRPAAVPESEEERQRVLAAARAEAESVKRQAAVEAKEVAQKVRAEAEAEVRARRQELDKQAAELGAKTQAVERKDRDLRGERDELQKKERQIQQREEAVETVARTAAERASEAKARLEHVSKLSQAEARKLLEAEVREEVRRDIAAEVKRIEDEARAQAEDKGRMILGAAIQRYASEYVTERTVSVVALPSDDMKGRIIGREGRNIRALEAATGIDLIIDDTPEAVVISCFNPVRREIARLALTRLISDGRIHPSRIEEMVAKATEEVEQQCKDAGEQAVFDLGIGRLHPELVRLVGKLKFRSSNAQNLLQHSIEVGFLAGAIAGELGISVKAARRAGLLHDLGKAVDQEIEGSHAQVGAMLAKKYGEPPAVVHAIEAHHGELPATDVLDHVVDAANVLSGQRPGARREMLESYVQRLGEMEKIATEFAGVEKAFAIQAGRELRILVENSRVNDEQARLLSRDIARRVESELSFPGQVRVAVIRETRATDYAK